MSDFLLRMVKDFFELLIEFIKVAAWPSLIWYIALRYTKEFKSILNRLQTAKFGGAEVSLSKEEAKKLVDKTLQESVKLITPSIDSIANINRRDADRIISISANDIDGDGKDELITSTIEGPYSVHIRVFKPVVTLVSDDHFENKFVLIGEIYPANFIEDIKDVDNDDCYEIIVNEDDPEKRHFEGYKERVVYKWNVDKFIEVSREKIPLPQEESQ